LGSYLRKTGKGETGKNYGKGKSRRLPEKGGGVGNSIEGKKG